MAVLQSKPNLLGALGDNTREVAEICQSKDYCIQYFTLFTVKHPLSQNDLLKQKLLQVKPAQIPNEKYVFLLFAIY